MAKKKKEEPSVEGKALDLALAAIHKQFGKEAIQKLGEAKSYESIPRRSSGILGIDNILGGGIPEGRIIEIYGPESCIAAESYLPYEIWSKDDKIRRNHKGGSIRRLYERFHNIICDQEPKQGRHLQNNDSKFYIKSVNHEDCIIRNEVLDVVKTGTKICYRVETADGQVLYSTREHKYKTPDGYFPLGELGVGTLLFVHNNTRTEGRKNYENRPEVFVKYHPCLPTKIVKNNNSEKEYLYYRGQKSRMVYEASLNNMKYDDYIFFLNTQSKYNIENLIFLPDNIHVHHEDENFNNNKIENLKLIDPKEHGILHSNDRIKNLSFITVASPIISIKEIGEMETYDLKCAYPYNNYIAEGIVVHNSGKTTLALHFSAECQKAGGAVAFIDAEHALDVSYAAKLEVDVPNLLISQPDCGEQALEIAEMLIRTKAIGLLVIDSVAALTPRKEIEGEMGDSHMGLQARMMSQAMRKLTAAIAQSNTTVIFINQLRMKIGVMFGNPECVASDTMVEILVD